jgi:hypothetical protein
MSAILAMVTVVPFVSGSRDVAHAQVVDVSNATVTCNTILKGALKISPALVGGGTEPGATIKLKAKLAGCTASAPITLPDGKSSLSAVITVPDNDCTNLLSGAAASGTMTVKWKALQKIEPAVSTVTIPAGSLTAGLLTPGWGASYGYLGFGINDRPSGSPGLPLSVTGAFTGGSGGANSTADFVSQEDIFVLLNGCGSPAGVKALNSGIAQLFLG